MTSFSLKLIAIVTMLCDHASDALIGHLTWINIIGRIAFPIFCFQIVIGYGKTKSVSNYMKRLFIFGLISQIPFSLFLYAYTGNFMSLNIFFTLLMGICAIAILDNMKNKWLAILIDIAIIILAEMLNVDYGAWGICLILCIFVFFKRKCKNK